jgi:uncharacterized protein with HEPN domain
MDEIERLVSSIDEAAFAADRVRRLATERLVEIVSEASRHLPESDKASEPDIPWRRVADIGNRLRHAYHDVDAEVLWTVATRDIAALRSAVERIAGRYLERE